MDNKEERPVGRPTVMTPEVVAKLEHGFAMGFSDVEASLYANISKDSLYDYCKKYPEFSHRKEELKNHPKLLAKTNLYNALKENSKIEDSKWYLERKDKEFKPKSEQDLTTLGKEIKAINYILPNGDNIDPNSKATSSL